MTDALRKLEDIRSKITSLQHQEKQIQESLASELVKVLEEADILSVDFKTLVGGMLHVQHTANTDPRAAEAWQQSGEKFLKKRIKGRNKQTPNGTSTGTKGNTKKSGRTDQNRDEKAV